MATVAVPNTNRKAPRAYYAWLDEDHGILTQDAQGQVWFRNSATDHLTAITPEHLNFLSVHGEIGLAETQQVMDRLAGGCVGVCTSRQMEV